MTERIKKAIDIFLDAVNEGTLAKGTPCGCAVGNLLAHGKGATLSWDDEYQIVSDIENESWYDLVFELFLGKYPIEENEKFILKKLSKEVELYTDFTVEEIIKIEHTFEDNTEIGHKAYCRHSKEEIRADQIKGLEAVIKLMMTFDEVKEDVKEVFTNKLELVE